MNTDNYKYLIIFPIPSRESKLLCDMMDKIARLTKPSPPYISPPYERLSPYVTFHRPISGINEDVLKNILQSAILQIKVTRIRLNGLDCFGKQYIVAPVQATASVAHLWIALLQLLQRIPEYKHEKFDHDNTLHVTMAEKIFTVFDKIWPKVRRFKFDAMDIIFDKMELWRKSVTGGSWEKVETFCLPR